MHGMPHLNSSRREFLWDMGAGFTGVALSGMLQSDGFFKSAKANESVTGDARLLAPRPQHFPTKAKSVIFLFMYGGPSQMDTFDYKPELQKRDGEEVQTEIRRRSVQSTKLLASRRKFAQHGESGLWCSDAFPHMSQHMDEMAVIKSLYSDSFAHGSAMLQMNSGRILQGYPSMGAWLAYGLGSENQNLPGYVVMLDPRGGPISGAVNWSSGFMPAAYQGTVFRSSGQPILNLSATNGITSRMQREQIDTLNELNARHLAQHPGYSELQARIASYELAFQLQRTAPESLDLTQETEATQRMYGIYDPKPDHPLAVGPEHFGRQCLIARRLVERGVRFVQIYSGGGNQQTSWDAHFGMEENLKIHAPEADRPIAGLLTDLKQRGLLDETLVIWGGEFGRQPVSQGNEHGRDHNPKGFTYWMAGGGVKKGISYGNTDDLGMEAVENRHHIRDLHATILHLMGLDHNKLHYFYGGLEQKLTGVVEAEPIHGVIA
ncbi:DUF1501 domain-containing protein [Planctomicrobium sp. SH661]|uniref:DUF1501 domain-containing protein n=1 Tax=Planctomicrobium sp. SH661 TaxID=3448124 RepID=UPI003F5CA41B